MSIVLAIGEYSTRARVFIDKRVGFLTHYLLQLQWLQFIAWT